MEKVQWNSINKKQNGLEQSKIKNHPSSLKAVKESGLCKVHGVADRMLSSFYHPFTTASGSRWRMAKECGTEWMRGIGRGECHGLCVNKPISFFSYNTGPNVNKKMTQPDALEALWFLILIKWFLTATSGTKPIIVSAGHVYILLHQRKKRGSAIQYGYRKRGTHARVFPQTLVHGKQKWIRRDRRRRTEERRVFLYSVLPYELIWAHISCYSWRFTCYIPMYLIYILYHVLWK